MLCMALGIGVEESCVGTLVTPKVEAVSIASLQLGCWAQSRPSQLVGRTQKIVVQGCWGGVEEVEVAWDVLRRAE